MPQFDVYRNPNPRTRKAVPYLLDVQVDLLRDAVRRVIVPLIPTGGFTPIREINPVFEVEGTPVVMSTLEMASVPREVLGEWVASLSSERSRIVGAIDWLVTGV